MNLGQIKTGIRHPGSAARFLSDRGRSAVLRWTFDTSGIHILDRDWDTLIILDCGRYDVFSEIIDSPGTLTKERSLASVTADFVKRNFRGRRAHDVVYLSANPVVGSQEGYLDIYKLVGVWHETEQRKRGQENQRGITDPKPVVEKAIELHEEYPNKRHIVHILPPHVPHTLKDGEVLASESPYRNYNAARDGEVDASVMKTVYKENYKHVINAIQPLLTEINGKKVITSDHGELLGEGMPRWMKSLHTRWGNQWDKYDFGHYSDIDVPELVDIPWFELPVETRREVDSEPPVANTYNSDKIKKKLELLGYR